MEFEFGGSLNAHIDEERFLAPVIKKIIKTCENLPDSKLLFIEDIAKYINYAYSHLQSVAAQTPSKYSTVTTVVVLNGAGKEVMRMKRVFGNSKTIEALKQWEKQKIENQNK